MASRYNSYDSTRSSASSFISDLASSAEFNPSSTPYSSSSSSRALVKSKPSDLSQLKSASAKSKLATTHNLSAMVKKFMEKKKTTPASMSGKGSSSRNPPGFVIPADLIAEDLKKTARKAPGLGGLQKKLFGKEKEKRKKEVKALTEVKGCNNSNVANTRTLAMVLRSERELLGANKEMEAEVSELRLMLETKSREVEKLKDLCLKQREEIKSLKNAVLFPEVMNSELQDVLEQQGSELKQAKQIIPSLQRQVTSLTGQLQCLAEGLAEVKAEKYGRVRGSGSPRTPPSYDGQGSANSLDDFSSCGATTPGSPDEMFVKDLNPCLTPYGAKTKSKEFDEMGYDCASSFEEYPPENTMQMSEELTFSSSLRKLSRSSDRYQSSNAGSAAARAARRSDESKYKLGKQMHHVLFT